MLGQVQHPGGLVLVEGADPTAAQSQGDGGQKNVFRGRSRVLQTVELAASLAIAARRLLGVGADDDDDRAT
jgi:hypothetical protein